MDDKARIAELERKVEWLTRKLDEARRVCGLAAIIDDQLVFINQRRDRGFPGGSAA